MSLWQPPTPVTPFSQHCKATVASGVVTPLASVYGARRGSFSSPGWMHLSVSPVFPFTTLTPAGGISTPRHDFLVYTGFLL